MLCSNVDPSFFFNRTRVADAKHLYCIVGVRGKPAASPGALGQLEPQAMDRWSNPIHCKRRDWTQRRTKSGDGAHMSGGRGRQNAGHGRSESVQARLRARCCVHTNGGGGSGFHIEPPSSSESGGAEEPTCPARDVPSSCLVPEVPEPSRLSPACPSSPSFSRRQAFRPWARPDSERDMFTPKHPIELSNAHH